MPLALDFFGGKAIKSLIEGLPLMSGDLYLEKYLRASVEKNYLEGTHHGRT
jgi:hypothetical protein